MDEKKKGPVPVTEAQLRACEFMSKVGNIVAGLNVQICPWCEKEGILRVLRDEKILGWVHGEESAFRACAVKYEIQDEYIEPK